MPATATDTKKVAEKFRNIVSEIKTEVVERDSEADLLVRAIVSKSNGLFIGPPGVAKSLVIDTMLDHVDGAQVFKLLLAKDTPSEQVLGPVSLAALKNDEFMRMTTGKMPEAHLAFLDEIFKSNSTVLNALLKVINEKRFDNNGHSVDVPLWSVIGASNELPGPDRDDLSAFRDRFAFTKMVSHVRTSDGLKSVISGQIERNRGNTVAQTHTMVSLDEIAAIQAASVAVDVPETVKTALADLHKRSEEENLTMSARRLGEGVKLMQAGAVLTDRTELSTEDMKIFEHILWTDPEDHGTAYELTLDYAGAVTKKAAKIRGEFEEQKRALNDLQSEMPTAGEMPDGDLMGRIGKVSNLLRAIKSRADDAISSANDESHDPSELQEVVVDIESCQKTVAKMLGIGD